MRVFLPLMLLATMIGYDLQNNFPVKRVGLPNGLVALVMEDHRWPVVAIVTRVKVGYFNEPDSLTGISHLLEHMFFKGTDRRGVGEIARQTRAAGGYLNGATGYEATVYHTVLPRDAWAVGMDIQSDALRRCRLDSTELVREAQVVAQEMRRKLDNPVMFSYEKLLALAFERHHIRRWRMGTPEQLAAWTQATLDNHYRSTYLPQNIILCVVGDINADSVISRIWEYYADMPGGDRQLLQSPTEPPQTAFKYQRLTADIGRKIVHVGFHVPGFSHPDFYALVVLNSIFGSGKSSRLYREIRERQQLAETIGSTFDWFRDFGYLTVTAEQTQGDFSELLPAIIEQIERFKLVDVSRAELSRAQNQLLAGYLSRFESVNLLAHDLAFFEDYGDYRLAFEYVDRIKQVTAADIRRVATTYFNLDNCSVLEYLPESESVFEPTAELLNRTLAQRLEDYRLSFPKPPDEVAPVVVGRQSQEPDVMETPVVKKVLRDGITLICHQIHSLPLVSVAAYFRGGMVFEDQNKAGITLLMTKCSLKGAGRMSAEVIAGDIESLGGSLDYDCDDDHFGFRLQALSENVEECFAIMAQVIMNPTFPEAEVEKEKKDQIAAILRQRDSNAEYPIELCRQALFAGTPYGRPSLGDPEAVARLSSADLFNWHRRLVTTGNLVISMVGDITMVEAERLVRSYLRQMNQGPPLEFPAIHLTSPAAKAKHEKRKRTQTAQAFGFLSCSAASPDYEPLKVCQAILSGMGSRLWDVIRDQRSLAYSVYAYQESKATAGNFLCYMATSPEKAAEARKAALEVFSGLVNKPCDPEELEMAKNYVAGSYLISLETNSAKADLYARWEILGRGCETVADYPQRIKAVSGADVVRVARKYFAKKRYALGLVEGVSPAEE